MLPFKKLKLPFKIVNCSWEGSSLKLLWYHSNSSGDIDDCVIVQVCAAIYTAASGPSGGVGPSFLGVEWAQVAPIISYMIAEIVKRLSWGERLEMVGKKYPKIAGICLSKLRDPLNIAATPPQKKTPLGAVPEIPSRPLSHAPVNEVCVECGAGDLFMEAHLYHYHLF